MKSVEDTPGGHRRVRPAAYGLAAAVTVGATVLATMPGQSLEARPPTGMLVIAHRGAPVYVSENTVNSWQRAAALGADMLEADFVMSKDGVLFANHDLELTLNTDVETAFPGRRTDRVFNGITYSGWWADEFTWAELQSLRTPDGQQLATLDQLIDVAQSTDRQAYAELKLSPYFAATGRDIVPAAVAVLQRRGESARTSRVWIQSNLEDDLRRLRASVGNRLVYLTREVSAEQIGNFAVYRQFADVLGVPTTRVRRSLVQEAHAADLGIHVWTLRGSRDAYRKAAAVGADGVITDFPDLGWDVRNGARQGGRPQGLTARVEGGNAIASWTWGGAGALYAVTFNFGEPLEAPTIWTDQASATLPMGVSKSVRVTVSQYNGTRLGDDAWARASLEPSDPLLNPAIRTRVQDFTVESRPDAKNVLRGRFEFLHPKKKKWLPLRKQAGWMLGRGDDVQSLRRKLTTDRRGEFTIYVTVREDITSGYIPQRQWQVGVTQTKRYRVSSSKWTQGEEGPPPEPTGKPRQTRTLPNTEVQVRSVR